MAKGKITVSNFSEQTLTIHIYSNTASGHLVASGSLNSAQSSGFLVSGYNEYKINFRTANGGPLTATNIVPNAVVQLEINGG
jgi:hypothetical protein